MATWRAAVSQLGHTPVLAELSRTAVSTDWYSSYAWQWWETLTHEPQTQNESQPGNPMTAIDAPGIRNALSPARESLFTSSAQVQHIVCAGSVESCKIINSQTSRRHRLIALSVRSVISLSNSKYSFLTSVLEVCRGHKLSMGSDHPRAIW